MTTPVERTEYPPFAYTESELKASVGRFKFEPLGDDGLPHGAPADMAIPPDVAPDPLPDPPEDPYLLHDEISSTPDYAEDTPAVDPPVRAADEDGKSAPKKAPAKKAAPKAEAKAPEPKKDLDPPKPAGKDVPVVEAPVKVVAPEPKKAEPAKPPPGPASARAERK